MESSGVGQIDVVARISHYKLAPDAIRALNDEIVRLARAHAPYDLRLRASFLFVSSTGSAMTLTVADSREGLLTAPTERHDAARAEVKDYGVDDWFIASPREVCPAAAELRYHALDEPLGPRHYESEGVWAQFLLRDQAAGRGVAITVFDETTTFPGVDAERWQPEYFMVRHSAPDDQQARPGHAAA